MSTQPLKNSIKIRAWDTELKYFVRNCDFKIYQDTRGHIFAISTMNNNELKIIAEPYKRKKYVRKIK